MTFDVAIIGGGPGGSTCATLLKKYAPELRVRVLEREVFPRDHVGESQLPAVSAVLQEMGVWEKVERAGFPIKIGATYKWGTTNDLWDFEFLLGTEFQDEPRPAQYEGQRLRTAFQVDRAVYDKILLDHAAEQGVEVSEAARVVEVQREGDRVTGLRLDSGEVVVADRYVDASGHTGVLRRAMGVETHSPTTLQNIAIWDYFTDAEWAVTLGSGGTRVQVMSLGYGWIWFIPITATRTSVGLVVPADYYKSSGMKPRELFDKALAEEPRIADLLRNAQAENKLATTKDWSFLANRMAGENWFLVGESCGFADPILAAGMTLAHQGARECAYTILEEKRGTAPADWLRAEYDATQTKRIGQHIRFADYWYTANAHFTDLKEFCADIARESGLELSGNQAFQWLGTGGFVDSTVHVPMYSGFRIDDVRQIAQMMTQTPISSLLDGRNWFGYDLEGAKDVVTPSYVKGRVEMVKCKERNGKRLPMLGAYPYVLHILEHAHTIEEIRTFVLREARRRGAMAHAEEHVSVLLQTLEAMVADGWVQVVPLADIPEGTLPLPMENDAVHFNRDNRVLAEAAR